MVECTQSITQTKLFFVTVLWTSKHKHPFRMYTVVGLSFVVNKHTFICMYALESAAAPVTRLRAGESRTDIYITICRCMLYIVYVHPLCIAVCDTACIWFVWFFHSTHRISEPPTHLYSPRWKKKGRAECALFLNLEINNWVRLQQVTLWFTRRRLHSIDFIWRLFKLQYHNCALEEDILLLIFSGWVSNLFNCLLYARKSSSSRGRVSRPPQ